jgi:hydrogenase/urease accessory protein HupE
LRSFRAWPDRGGTVPAAIAAFLVPRDAWAHSPLPGIEGFYTGLLHPLTAPEQILALLAVALLLAPMARRHIARAWSALALGTVVGIGLGQIELTTGHEPIVLFGLACATASLSALGPTPPAGLGIALAGGAGLLLGIVSTPDPGTVQDTAVTVSGSLVGVTVGLLYAAGGLSWLLDRFRQPAVRVGFRVAAAWVAAIALLMTAFALAET